MQTSNYAAEYGQAGGGYFNYTMKSGTNQFHGAAFDYFVNEGLNAGTPFTDRIATGDATRAGQQWLISTVSAFRDMDKTNALADGNPFAPGNRFGNPTVSFPDFTQKYPYEIAPGLRPPQLRSSRSTGTPDVLLDRYTGASVCSISSQTI